MGALSNNASNESNKIEQSNMLQFGTVFDSKLVGGNQASSLKENIEFEGLELSAFFETICIFSLRFQGKVLLLSNLLEKNEIWLEKFQGVLLENK